MLTIDDILTVEQIQERVSELTPVRGSVNRENYRVIARKIHPVVNSEIPRKLGDDVYMSLTLAFLCDPVVSAASKQDKRASVSISGGSDWTDMAVSAVTIWQDRRAKNEWMRLYGDYYVNHPNPAELLQEAIAKYNAEKGDA